MYEEVGFLHRRREKKHEIELLSSQESLTFAREALQIIEKKMFLANDLTLCMHRGHAFIVHIGLHTHTDTYYTEVDVYTLTRIK